MAPLTLRILVRNISNCFDIFLIEILTKIPWELWSKRVGFFCSKFLSEFSMRTYNSHRWKPFLFTLGQFLLAKENTMARPGTEVHSEPNQGKRKRFCENSWPFPQKAPSQMFDWVLNMPVGYWLKLTIKIKDQRASIIFKSVFLMLRKHLSIVGPPQSLSNVMPKFLFSPALRLILGQLLEYRATN